MQSTSKAIQSEHARPKKAVCPRCMSLKIFAVKNCHCPLPEPNRGSKYNSVLFCMDFSLDWTSQNLKNRSYHYSNNLDLTANRHAGHNRASEEKKLPTHPPVLYVLYSSDPHFIIFMNCICLMTRIIDSIITWLADVISRNFFWVEWTWLYLHTSVCTLFAMLCTAYVSDV